MNLIQRSYTLQLQAGQEAEIAAQGHMFQVTQSESPFEITFDGSNRFIGVSTGMGSRFGQNYERVMLKSSTAQTVVIVLGFGDFKDSRLNISTAVSTTEQVSNQLSNDNEIQVTGGAVQLVAADENRKAVIVAVPSDAENGIRVGSSLVSATSGLKVEPGEKFGVETEAAVFAIRDGAQDVTVSLLNLSRV